MRLSIRPGETGDGEEYSVLSSLFPAQHDRLLAPYNESLGGIPDERAETTGIHVGTLAADAMLAKSHDGPFYATSNRFPGEQRVFHRFSDVINEMIEARIWAGIHFRTPDAQSANLGREVERYIPKHWFAAAH